MEAVKEFKTNRERDDHLIGVLKDVKYLYQGAMKLDARMIDEMVLALVLNTIESSGEEDLQVLVEDARRYQDAFVWDDWYSESLLDHVYESFKARFGNTSYVRLFKYTQFSRIQTFFKIVYNVIENDFSKVNLDNFKKSDQYIIMKLQNAVASTLVNDVNMNGDNPYYERNLSDLYSSKKVTLSILDDLFDNYIGYFEEDEEEE